MVTLARAAATSIDPCGGSDVISMIGTGAVHASTSERASWTSGIDSSGRSDRNEIRNPAVRSVRQVHTVVGIVTSDVGAHS